MSNFLPEKALIGDPRDWEYDCNERGEWISHIACENWEEKVAKDFSHKTGAERKSGINHEVQYTNHWCCECGANLVWFTWDWDPIYDENEELYYNE